MTSKKNSNLADGVLSRQALHDLNAIYCRAVDRCEPELLASLFHEDAIVDFGEPMPASEWVPMIIDVELSLARGFHSVACEWFDIRGDKAIGERYLFSEITQEFEGVSTESLLGSRYVGRYERRNGVWKFSLHAFLMDWNSNYPSDQFWDASTYGASKETGKHTPDDPVERMAFSNALPVIAATTNDDLMLRELANKQALDQVIAAHSRGLDNAETALLKSCYHPEGIVEYGLFEGAASDFLEAFMQDDGTPATMHRPSAVWSVIDGDTAKAETSVIVYREEGEGSAKLQQFVCGRYLDTFERRDGVWKIIKRVYVLDWNSNMQDTSAWENPLYAACPRGVKAVDDKFHQLLADWSRDTKSVQPADVGNRTSELAGQAVAKQELREISLAYCRAVDRGDQQLFAGLFTDAAKVSVDGYDGDAAGFAAQQETGKPGLVRCFHSVSTDYSEINGDEAVGATYLIRFDTAQVEGQERDTIQGGRFLDRFQCVDGIWKISERRYVVEWVLNLPGTGTWDEGIYAQLPLHGTRGSDDPVYGFWPK